MTDEKLKHVLIVEDDRFIAEVYTTKLVSEGFDVVVAEDGTEALQKIEKKLPNLVLLDLLMPKMNGIEVLEKINKDSRFGSIRVVVLTNASEKDYISQAMKLGASDYLIKSNFTPDEVVERIKDKLK